MSNERDDPVEYDLSRPISRGRTSEIFDAGPGQVLKLYLSGWPESTPHREFEIAGVIETAGVPAPQAHKFESVNGRTGIIFDKVSGNALLDILPRKPWRIAAYARTLAAVHTSIHAKPGAGLPALRARLEDRIRSAPGLGPEYRDAALRLLGALPDGAALCHGDFHPANVIMRPEGPAVIDWPDASSGTPLADVARSLILMRFGPLAERSPARRVLFRGFSRVFAGRYLAEYLKLNGVADRRQVRRWEAVCGVTRLTEGIAGERPALLKFARRLLNAYAPLK